MYTTHVKYTRKHQRDYNEINKRKISILTDICHIIKMIPTVSKRDFVSVTQTPRCGHAEMLRQNLCMLERSQGHTDHPSPGDGPVGPWFNLIPVATQQPHAQCHIARHREGREHQPTYHLDRHSNIHGRKRLGASISRVLDGHGVGRR